MKRIVRFSPAPHRILLSVALLAITTMTVVTEATAEEHAFLYSDGVTTDLGTLGGTQSEAVAINDSGQVVGTSTTADNRRYPFLYSNGVMTELGALDRWPNEAVAMNDSGQVVGTSVGHAFLYSGGIMTELGTLGGSESEAVAINKAGQVVGNSQPLGCYSMDCVHAFLYSGGVMTDLGTLDGPGRSDAVAINDSGQVVGSSTPNGGEPHAFLYSGGVMTDLGTLGGTRSYATAINDAGQVVGSSGPPGCHHDWNCQHAFLYSGGVMTDLGTLGGTWSAAAAINDAGQVVGSSGPPGCDNWFCRHAFLYSNGVMTDIGTLGGTPSEAVAINDSGQVVGTSVGHACLYSGGVMTELGMPEHIGDSRGVAINNRGQVIGSMQPGGCDDGNPCTSGDAWNWSGDVCTGQPQDWLCSDGDPCTLDTCDLVLGCQHAPSVGPTYDCFDGNACTLDTCDELGVCQHVPTCDCPLVPSETCLSAGKSSLLIKRNSADDTKDRITWKWNSGTEFLQADLGNPQSDTTYTLCVYDSRSYRAGACHCWACARHQIGGLWIRPSANWSDQNPHGWSYSDKTGSQAGVQKVQLRTGSAGNTRTRVDAKGANIPPLPPAEAAWDYDWPLEVCDEGSPTDERGVIVQLINNMTSTCWASQFLRDTVIKNNATRFQARTR